MRDTRYWVYGIILGLLVADIFGIGIQIQPLNRGNALNEVYVQEVNKLVQEEKANNMEYCDHGNGLVMNDGSCIDGHFGGKCPSPSPYVGTCTWTPDNGQPLPQNN